MIQPVHSARIEHEAQVILDLTLMLCGLLARSEAEYASGMLHVAWQIHATAERVRRDVTIDLRPVIAGLDKLDHVYRR